MIANQQFGVSWVRFVFQSVLGDGSDPVQDTHGFLVSGLDAEPALQFAVKVLGHVLPQGSEIPQAEVGGWLHRSSFGRRR